MSSAQPPQRVERPRVSLETGLASSLLLLSFYYLAYRYPFKINSSTTSPTYSDTPTLLQLGKYLVFVLVSAWYLARRIISRPLPRVAWRDLVDVLAGLYVFAFALIGAVATKNEMLAQSGIFFVVLPIFIVLRVGDIDLAKVSNAIGWMLAIGIAVGFFQIALFLTVGRLPALAFSGTLSVRFGSVWDDPNGWAVFSALLLGYTWAARWRLAAKISITILLGFLLLLTESLTGIAATSLAIILMLGLLLRARVRWQWLGQAGAVALVYPLIISAIALIVIPSAAFQAFWAEKQGSVLVHLQHFAAADDLTFPRLLGVAPLGEYGEPGYLNLLTNLGLPYLCAFLYLTIPAMLRLARQIANAPDGSDLRVQYGALLFLSSFHLGMVNLPLDIVFPVNLLVVICVLISRQDVPLAR